MSSGMRQRLKKKTKTILLHSLKRLPVILLNNLQSLMHCCKANNTKKPYTLYLNMPQKLLKYWKIKVSCRVINIKIIFKNFGVSLKKLKSDMAENQKKANKVFFHQEFRKNLKKYSNSNRMSLMKLTKCLEMLLQIFDQNKIIRLNHRYNIIILLGKKFNL